MQMTKRDIADIVLVWMVFSTLFHFLMGIAQFLALVVAPGLRESTQLMAITGFEALYVLIVLLLCYIVLFKRAAILSFLFPDAREKELSIPFGMDSLASYAFWLRLFSIYICVSSGTSFFGHLVAGAAVGGQFGAERFLIRTSMPTLVSAVLAGLIVWKADWIAEKLQKIGTDRGRVNNVDAKNQ